MDNPVLTAINQTLYSVSRGVQAVPGSAIAINYIKNSYQNDPFRVVLELGLAIYAVKYMLSKKYRIDHNHVKLTEKVRIIIMRLMCQVFLQSLWTDRMELPSSLYRKSMSWCRNGSQSLLSSLYPKSREWSLTRPTSSWGKVSHLSSGTIAIGSQT